MGLLPLAFFWPVLMRAWRRFKKRPAMDSAVGLSLYHRCLCALLACIFLIGPETFQTLAHGDVAYADLTASAWGAAGDTITYTYDVNGSVESKTTAVTGGNTKETVAYEYDLRDRLTKITTTPYDAFGDPDDTQTLVTYTYNPQGIRVSKCTWTETLGVSNNDEVETSYLIDPYNHTGYAQVLEERTDDGSTVEMVTYTIGDDVISQTDSSGATAFFLYDGQGSTRQLADASGAVNTNDSYSYDAYGVMLGGNPAAGSDPATRLLYTGEQFDEHAQHYYLRARYYNPLNGRFNRMDPYAGSPQDPQSLHKYLYCHANPMNSIDPSGRMGIVGWIATISIIAILGSIVVRPKMWARLGSYGIRKLGEGDMPLNIAVVDGKLGYWQEWKYGWSGVNFHEYATELRAAGHNVTYSACPTEDEFVDLLNSNSLVIAAGHGAEIYGRVAAGDMIDSQNRLFAGIRLGGISVNNYDVVRDSTSDYEVTPSAEWITANELQGRISNADCELVAISCQLGKTSRFQEAIGPCTFIGATRDVGISGREVMDMLQYSTDRANGIGTDVAFETLHRRGSYYVKYP